MAESGIEDITRSDKEDVTIQIESIKEEGASDTATQEKSLPLTFGNKRRCCKVLKVALYSLLTMGYFVYFGFALALNFRKAIPLLCVTGFVCFCVIYHILRRLCSKFVFRNYTTCRERIKSRISARKKRICLIGICVIVILSLLTYVVISNLNTPENLISFVGIAVLLMMSWLISYNRQQIKWRPMVWGMTLQLLLGLFVLRTTAGKETFSFLGEQVETFLNYVVAGVRFVFGDKYKDFEFAFKLMPTVIFLSSVTSVLYHMGLMQIIVEKIAVLMQVTMGTTAAETLSTAASIFLGQVKLAKRTRSFTDDSPISWRDDTFGTTCNHDSWVCLRLCRYLRTFCQLWYKIVTYSDGSSHVGTCRSCCVKNHLPRDGGVQNENLETNKRD